jgi:hypothetical protein
MDAVADRLLAKLRQLAPSKVRVYDGAGEHRDVAVPNRRKRWSPVIEAIESKPWVQCELLDKQGAVLGYVENDGEAKEIENLAAGSGKDRWFLEMMLKAQETALRWRSKDHEALLAGMANMLEANTRATHELIEIFRVQRDVSADIAAMQAAAENGGDFDQVIKLIEASPQLMTVLAPMLQLLLSRKAKPKLAPPPNGAKQS